MLAMVWLQVVVRAWDGNGGCRNDHDVPVSFDPSPTRRKGAVLTVESFHGIKEAL